MKSRYRNMSVGGDSGSVSTAPAVLNGSTRETGNANMLHRIRLLMVFSVMALLVAIAVIVMAAQREQALVAQQFAQQKKLLSETSYSIARYILDKRRALQSFVTENHGLLLRLRFDPQNPSLYALLQQRVAARFPHQTHFTIIDQHGSPIWMDIEGEVGPVCRSEIALFNKEVQESGASATNKILIHPNVNTYHYDLMALLAVSPGVNNIFLVSFDPATLVEILKRHELSGHHLMLVKKGDNSLIEVTSAGARDRIGRDIRLDSEELSRIKTFAEVDGTGWRVVDLQDKARIEAWRTHLWQRAIIMGITFLLASLVLMVMLQRIGRRN